MFRMHGKYIWGIRPIQSYSYSDWHYSLDTPPIAMATPSNLPGGGGGGGAARLVPALPMVLILQLHLHTVRAEGGTIWGEDQKRGPSKYIYSQPWNPTGEYLLRHFLHRFANFIDVAAHAPQDLQRADCNFVSQMERLGEVKLPTGCEDVWRHCLVCQNWHRIQPEQFFVGMTNLRLKDLASLYCLAGWLATQSSVLSCMTAWPFTWLFAWGPLQYLNRSSMLVFHGFWVWDTKCIEMWFR